MPTSNAFPGPLVSVAALLQDRDHPSSVVVDCRFDLASPGWGEAAYLEAHIPGAVYAHLDRDLSAPMTGKNGRHPLPEVEAMAATMGRLGIEAGMRVVVYDQGHGMCASRLWWMLRFLGHDAVAVLDGGFARWIADGRPVGSGREVRAARAFTASPRPHLLMTAEDVARIVGRADWRLLDARAPERFRGEIEPLDPVAGHIPGAVNAPWAENIDANGQFQPAAELRARFAPLIGHIVPDRAVAYCGSGVSACHDVLAMELAGLTGVRLYAGSWSEWCADRSRPVERGDAPGR